MLKHMMASLRLKKPALVGVDIAAEAVKIMVLERQAAEFSIKNFAVMPLSPNTILDKKIKQPTQVTRAIKEALILANCDLDSAIIAIPAAMVISKFIQMDADLSAEELEAEISFEVEKYLPHPLENISTDFHVLGPIAGEPTKVNVLLIATLSDYVQERITILTNAGLAVAVVDVEPYALQRAAALNLTHLLDSHFQDYIVLIDISATEINFSVIQHAQLVYHHQELCSDNQDLQLILSQIQHCLQLFSLSASDGKIAYILLSGAIVLLSDLAKCLQNQLNMTVQVANPIKNMHFSALIDRQLIQKQAAALMTVTGLALRGLS